MKKKLALIIIMQFAIHSLMAQQTSFKFDFGNGKIAPGYIQITPQIKFNYQTGYGFD